MEENKRRNMNKQLTALKQSIKHWEDNIEKAIHHTLIPGDIGRYVCPCCNIYWWNGKKYCADCPIKILTNKTCCQYTPYDKIHLCGGDATDTIWDMTIKSVFLEYMFLLNCYYALGGKC